MINDCSRPGNETVFSNSPRRLVRGEELLPHRPTFASPGNLRRSSLTVQLSSRNEREARPYPFRAIEIDRENKLNCVRKGEKEDFAYAATKVHSG
jgi:hypothetical protein